ncbi:AsmA family protein [Fulvimarina endophytica]|uniref:AsmA family protein n=1 Tax=Fulvimarina endophytica TaxID=2293836 RepID=A0A371WYN4_9HYPH|nr:AsmA-like C-terminal region-containing protein [Fulvimarina endophytica]RFC62101.1 AsmA family protein [Fulvimarina endophytica]
MRPRPLKRRWIWGIGSLVALAALIVLLPRFVLASDGARAELVQRIETLTGEPAAISGPVEFDLFPRARLVADRIAIGTAAETRIERIIADFDPIDALFGEARISRIVLVRPERDGASVPPADPAGTGAVAGPERRARDSAAFVADLAELARGAIDRLDDLQILVIRNGIWRSSEETFGPNGISNANLTITRASNLSAFQMVGDFVWNGVPATMEMNLASTQRLKAGQESAVDFDLSSPTLDLNFEGQVAFDPAPTLLGRFEARGDSFARTAAWLSDTRTEIPDLGAVSLTGSLVLEGRMLAVNDAELRVAGSAGRGALEYDLDRDHVDGTLAFSTLDLTPIAEAIVPLPSGPFGMMRPINVDFASTADLALRLSADEARFGSLAFANMAAVLTVGGGSVGLELGDASFYGGRAYGRLSLSGGADPVLSGELNGSGVDLGAVSNAFGTPVLVLSGNGRVGANISAPAEDWRTIARSAETQLTLSAADGSLSGFDPSVFATAGTRSIYSGITGGSLPFEELKADLRGYGTEVTVRSLSLGNANDLLEMSGRADPVEGRIALDGRSRSLPQTASSGTRSGEFTAPKPISFKVEGVWPDLRVVTDGPAASPSDASGIAAGGSAAP